MPAGRPSTYNSEIADEILDGVASGKSLVTVLKENDKFPGYSTVMQWLRKHPEFAENYARAREDQADHDADKIGEIAEEVRKGKVDPNSARVAIDAYKWAAGKRKPKVYGDKIALGGAQDLPPIQTTNSLDISGLSMEELEVLQQALQKSVKK